MSKYESLKEVTVNGNQVGARNVFDADPESEEIKQLLADGAIKLEGDPDPVPPAPTPAEEGKSEGEGEGEGEGDSE